MHGKIIVNAGILALALMMMAAAASAQAPSTLVYQGRLTDADGNPITNTVSVTFTIYSAASDGTNLWTGTKTLSPDNNGFFTAELGPISYTIFNGATRYLGIRVGADEEMTPRQPLASTPYAMRIGSVGSSMVGTIQLANNAVTGAKVADGSITSADITGMPGIAYRLSPDANSFEPLSSSTTAYDSVIIQAPGPGYVYVSALTSLKINHTLGTVDDFQMQISDTTDYIEYEQYGFGMSRMINDQPTGSYYQMANVHRVFEVASAGRHAYYVNMRMFYGYDAGDAYFDLQMTAFFFPVAYGNVDQPVVKDKANDDRPPGEAVGAVNK